MKTYLITGGAGFIGINYIKFLLKKYTDIKIIVLDKLTYASNMEALEEELKNKKIIFLKGDICDKDVVTEIFDTYDIDYLVNFAAETHVDRSIAQPDIFVKTNVLGTANLLERALYKWKQAKNFSEKRFLQISTDEVYGSLEIEYEKCQKIGNKNYYGNNFFTETDKLKPSSPYSASKAAADLLVLSYFHTYNLPVLISRTTNNYGPYQHEEKLIPKSIKKLLNGEKIALYGNGINVRDWIYVEDHCRALDVILHKGRLGEVYNIGVFNEFSNLEIAKLLISKVIKTANYCQHIEFINDRLGHDKRYAIDSTKIKKELNWDGIFSFDEALDRTIDYYKKS